MLFAVASLFLATILMTQANTIESDVTFIEPLSEELFIFDVISDATPAELKGSVKSAGVEIRHSFHVLGTRQYLFVVVGDRTGALGNLVFPKGSVVTQYPVQHIKDFYNMVGGSGWDGEDTEATLDDNNLLVFIWEVAVPHDTSTSQFKSIMQTTARTYQGADEKVKPVLYAVVGRYPAKIFFFGNVDENAAQKAVLDGLDAAGGPGNNVINCLRLRKV
ncbi:uncharacterized protein [Littorina saxatilis]|uniref:Uncharacterized protein n=1 Tax=Littorina saxatilis TaxID=31220 RepID=A0AAN9AJQ0_9CAEN